MYFRKEVSENVIVSWQMKRLESSDASWLMTSTTTKNRGIFHVRQPTNTCFQSIAKHGSSYAETSVLTALS
jgi:hypothetical protein